MPLLFAPGGIRFLTGQPLGQALGGRDRSVRPGN